MGIPKRRRTQRIAEINRGIRISIEDWDTQFRRSKKMHLNIAECTFSEARGADNQEAYRRYCFQGKDE